ncbi:MAG: hypothetical protein A3J28_07195 [Acidobacteria bacterium RIFCSPLOWO2_12_FULL_60_22]|nr:MAG: hypothetical protein A3J28_07195 [Acidobacteria bacterium RIFCSPLOWO2_12_FULL_60_22]
MPETPGTAERQQPEAAEAEGCPVDTFEPNVWYKGKKRKRCGRPPYSAPEGVDKRPVCLMHSRDPNKDNDAFQQEFERILEEAGEGEANFTLFVFPRADYAGREFKARCIFGDATFTQRANFIGATFTQEADFTRATFTQWANFRGATFTERADFSEATFTQRAGFSEATFTGEANFGGATFTQWANFVLATFTQKANFSVTKFTQMAHFNFAKFTQEAGFQWATFTQGAHFNCATFTQAAAFFNATFTQLANFGRARFSGEATFWKTTFRNDGEGVGPVFSEARFEKPERVVFYGNYLGQVLFHNCDVSKVEFSNVEWRKRKNGKRMVFEEVVSLEHKAASAEALNPPEGSADERNYGLIAELYQQLKKNFDDRRDYWTAGDFHYGEMEMKRVSSPRSNRVLRWLHRSLGLAAWYKYASEYGESYKRPAVWLGIFLLLFMVAYPDVGLQRNDGIPTPTSEIHYKNFFQFLEAHPKGAWAFFGHSLMTALSVMALQREVEYQPVYPWGRPLLTVFELVLSYTLIALFLLAVRRQFRR